MQANMQPVNFPYTVVGILPPYARIMQRKIRTVRTRTYIQTKTHTNNQTGDKRDYFSNPCKKTNKHGYHNKEEIFCGSSEQDLTAKGSKG